MLCSFKDPGSYPPFFLTYVKRETDVYIKKIGLVHIGFF